MQKTGLDNTVVIPMATASNTPGNVLAQSFAVGVCLPAEFPTGELRVALRQGGYEPAFWHNKADPAIKACIEADLDLFILGVRRPDADALAHVRSVADSVPSTKVILVCERSGEGDIRKALDAGARALVPLREAGAALLPVIEVVRAGQVSVPGPAGREAGRKVLTSREKQILGQVVLGMTNAEIASKLFLAESTIKSHLSSAFMKLGVTSRNEAAAVILNPATGVGLGILTIPSEKVSASR